MRFSVITTQQFYFFVQLCSTLIISLPCGNISQPLHGFKAAIKISPRNFTQSFNSSLKVRLGSLDLAGCKFSLAKTQKHQSLKDMIFRKCAALLKSAPLHLQRFIGAAELPIGIAQVVAGTNWPSVVNAITLVRHLVNALVVGNRRFQFFAAALLAKGATQIPECGYNVMVLTAKQLLCLLHGLTQNCLCLFIALLLQKQNPTTV